MRVIAAVSREAQPAPVLEELELTTPRAGEILVRVRTAGICHTDLRAHAGLIKLTPKPVVLGHEGAGIVEAVGEGLQRCFSGARLDGSTALSRGSETIHSHFFGQSSFATHTIAEARSAVKIAEDVPFEVASPLGCARGSPSLFSARAV
jgi:aryl-alcohol dehydrogenase